jgi:hypothetical protein
MKVFPALLAVILLSSVSARSASADVFYSQAPDASAQKSAWISETSHGSNGVGQAWDNFTLQSDAVINEVGWTGWINPVSGQINGFIISFYADTFDTTYGMDAPGALLFSLNVHGNAGQVQTGTPRPGVGAFDFHAGIPDFEAVAGTEYWISIVGDPGTNNRASYNWANSVGGDLNFFANNSDSGYTNAPIGTDLAFTLSDASPVPEPASLMLAGTGIFTLASVMRRRFSAA